MQTTPANSQVQAPPSPPAAPQISNGEGTTAAPLSSLSLNVLLNQRSELTTQLNSVASRRSELQRSLRRTNSLAQEGVLQHITQLDVRIGKIEADIAENSRQILLKSTTEQPSRFPGFLSNNGSDRMSGEVTAIMIVFTIFVLSPIAISMSRYLWKRGSRPTAPTSSRESDLRMERVEQSVDAIAVEIERISEGQRFVTQLLSKPAPNALGVGQAPAEPICIAVGEPVKVGMPRSSAIG